MKYHPLSQQLAEISRQQMDRHLGRKPRPSTKGAMKIAIASRLGLPRSQAEKEARERDGYFQENAETIASMVHRQAESRRGALRKAAMAFALRGRKGA
jgi:hypothetical protein